MSNQAITWAYEQDIEPSAAKFILVTLANFASEDGFCFPSQERLARDTGQSERAVRGHLARLEATGIIERDRRVDKLGHRAPDGFWLVGFRPRTDERAIRPAAASAGRKRTQAADSVIPTGNDRRSLAAESAGSITDEPSGEPSEEPALHSEDLREHEHEHEETDEERVVIDQLLTMPVIRDQPRHEVLTVYREAVRARGPRSPAADAGDALRFTLAYTDETGLLTRPLRNWRLELARWFSRTRNDDAGRQPTGRTPAYPGRYRGHGTPYADPRAEQPVVAGVRRRRGAT